MLYVYVIESNWYYIKLIKSLNILRPDRNRIYPQELFNRDVWIDVAGFHSLTFIQIKISAFERKSLPLILGYHFFYF